MKINKTPRTKANICSLEQRRFLLDLVNRRCYYKRQDLKEPPEVRAARRVISKFQTKRRRFLERQDVSYNKLVAKAKEAIHFGTPEQALAAVKRLTRLRP